MQTQAKFIISLILLLGAGSPSAVYAQTAEQNQSVATDSMECCRLVAAVGDVCPLAFHSDMERLTASFEKYLHWGRNKDLNFGYQYLGGEYREKQLNQDVASSMYPLYLKAFDGNEADLRTALSASLSEGGRVMWQLDVIVKGLMELSDKAISSTPPMKTADVALAAALKKEKKQWDATGKAENLDAYKKFYAAAGYSDYVGKAIKKRMKPAAAISGNTAKALAMLPELFGLMAASNGITGEQLDALLAHDTRGVALHIRLFDALSSASGNPVLKNLLAMFEAWLQPRFAEAQNLAREEEQRQQQAAREQEARKQALSQEPLGFEGWTYASAKGSQEGTRDSVSSSLQVALEAGEGVQPPMFPGGEAAMLAHIGQNIKYPLSALENEIQGMVILRFVVLEDGSICGGTIVRSLDPDCDKEAVRVVKSLPNFNPGKKEDGTPVKVWYTLPVRFQIN